MGSDKLGRTAGRIGLSAVRASRVMRARHNSICPICGKPILVGQQIAKRDIWMHIDHVISDMLER